METLRTKSRLRILHVTDVHSSFDNVSALGDRLKSSNETIDLVLLSGDIADMEMGTRDASSARAKITKYENDARRVVKGLEAIHPLVVYIPGNHDPITIFSSESPPKMTMTSINVHGRCVRLTDDLSLVGFGGSIPGYQNGKQVWEGFPFESEEDMAKELDPFLSLQFHPEPSGSDSPSAVREGDSVILMTHLGPSQTDTTIVHEGSITDPILTGSSTLRQNLESDLLQKSVFLNLHGHSHYAIGRSHLVNITVVNPGSLMEGNFGLYTISKDKEHGWKLVSCTFESLD
eukprot:m.140538 g.140538  ORF g.140538 m.140538 type:complete len:289 (+) comp38312_c0_seq6:264-1130(+)